MSWGRSGKGGRRPERRILATDPFDRVAEAWGYFEEVMERLALTDPEAAQRARAAMDARLTAEARRFEAEEGEERA